MDCSNKHSRQQRRANARAASKKARTGCYLAPRQTEAEAKADLDAAADDDRAFFERNPDRSHRMRPAVLAEIHEALARGGQATVPWKGTWCTLVHQVRPGVRFRQVVILRDEPGVDAGEAEARALWKQGAPPGSALDRLIKAARKFGL